MDEEEGEHLNMIRMVRVDDAVGDIF